MSERLDYLCPAGNKSARKWWKVVLYLALVASLLFASFYIFFWFDMETAHVSITVINKSAASVHGAQLRSGPQTLIDLGDIMPGKETVKSRRFYHDPGPTHFRASSGDNMYCSDTWLVLTGKGPYEYEITILADRIHVERWSPAKGTWKKDILPAATRATIGSD